MKYRKNNLDYWHIYGMCVWPPPPVPPHVLSDFVGWGAYYQAAYKLCLILKVMLRK